MAKISTLPLLATPTGAEQAVVDDGGVTKRAILSGLLATTRDPLALLRAKIGEAIMGTTTYVAGQPTTKRGILVIASLLNSHGIAQNATNASAPGEIARALWAAAFPQLDVYHDNYSIPGAWIANYENAMIDGEAAPASGTGPARPGILKAHAAAMAPGGDGRRRIPDIVLIGDPTNDALATIYNSLQPPSAFRDIADHLVRRCQTDFGALVIGYNAPMIECARSLANGRFTFSPAFFCSFPKTPLVLGDDKYQVLTYRVADQSITTNVMGEFTPGLFDNGLLTFDGTSWIHVEEQGKDMRLVGVDATCSKLFVDDGAGGPVITQDRTTTRGFFQCRIDDQRQLVPARNAPDFSRAATTQPGVPLAVEQRPYGASGELIHVSTRLIEHNQTWEGILAANGALLCDWAGEQRKIVTSDADITALYANGDDVHMGDAGYQLTRAPHKRIVDRAAYGLRGLGA